MIGIDFAAGLVSGLLAIAVRSDLDGQSVGPVDYPLLAIALPAVWIASQALVGAYSGRLAPCGNADITRTFRVAVVLTAIVGFISYASHAQLARGFVVVALPAVAALSALGRLAAQRLLRRGRRQGRWQRSVLVVGPRELVSRIIADLRADTESGMKAVAACLAPQGERPGTPLPGDVPVLGTIDDAAAIARRIGVDAVAVAASAQTTGAMLRRLSWELEASGTELLIAPGLAEVAVPRLRVHPVGTLPLLHVGQPELEGARRVIKACLDRFVAAILLMSLTVFLAVIAIGIRLGSRGPVIFRQTRIGRDGQPFTIFKFRTMTSDAEACRDELVRRHQQAGLLFKIKDDPRVTPFGRWLRRWSLDELPQLANVVLGDMSLVGPRPALPQEALQYTGDVRRRLLVKPGLTGLWQVSGRSDLSWEQTVRLDLFYVDNWSLGFDFVLLWRTASAVLGKSGAY